MAWNGVQKGGFASCRISVIPADLTAYQKRALLVPTPEAVADAQKSASSKYLAFSHVVDAPLL